MLMLKRFTKKEERERMLFMKDIFISYKNDGEGNNFAARLSKDLRDRGFSVYFNPDEQHAGDFPDRLRLAVEECKDFLLIVTRACLEQLINNEDVDWIREEVLTAKKHKKNIIPLLMPNTSMPKDNTIMPDALRFLPNQDAITMPETYDRSPLDQMLSWLVSKGIKDDEYKDAFNLNSNFDVQKKFESIMVESNAGNVRAKYQLALFYYYGITSEDGQSVRDYKKAFDLFDEVYKSNSTLKYHAATMIARMYSDGVADYNEQSFEKALYYHTIASEKSNESAQTVAYMNLVSRGCEFDYSTTEKLLAQHCKTGNDMAKIDMARFYLSYGDYQRAYETFCSMKKMSSAAYYEVGMMYKSGVLSDPIKPDYFKASYYFQNAINSDVPYTPAMRELAFLYFNGAGEFRVDFEKAKLYFEKGASAGDVYCHYMLGFMYEFGMLKRDLNKSLKHFLLADKRGDLNSAHHLAMIYQQPELRNYQKAFFFAEKSANNGKPEGEYIYANLLLFGRGCEPNENEAIKYYHRAFEQGYYPAKSMIELLNQ